MNKGLVRFVITTFLLVTTGLIVGVWYLFQAI